MGGRQCHHCKQWIEPGEAHDCWTTTEAALTGDLDEDLREAWERFRETAAELGEQRIYASGRAIMFARTTCYCFVRPRRSFLEVCIFLGRTVDAPQVKRATPASRTKVAHILHIRHRDEVEPPISDWMREAYETVETLSRPARAAGPPPSLAPGSTSLDAPPPSRRTRKPGAPGAGASAPARRRGRVSGRRRS